METCKLIVLKKHADFAGIIVTSHKLSESDEGASGFNSFEEYVEDWKKEERNECEQRFEQVMIVSKLDCMKLVNKLSKVLS